MQYIWMPISVFAALMQSVRTAAQKTLNERLSTMGTTYVRSLAGLPFLIAFLLTVLHLQGGGRPQWQTTFFVYSTIGALSQVLATALLIKLFRLRSFAVGSMLIKSDVLMTAIIGSLWFSEQLAPVGWAALAVVLVGVLILAAGRIGLRTLRDQQAVLSSEAIWVASGTALLFTFSYLSIREATLVLQPGGVFWRGAWTVVTVTTMQVAGLGLWLLLREPGVFKQLWPNRRIISFIGLTSALGSMGWFTAFAIANASYVRAVAQIEAIFTLVISWFYFRERINRAELAGIAIIVAGVLMFRLVD